MSRAALPSHREAVAIAHVNVCDVRGALAYQLRGREHEALEALIDLLAAQAHPHAVVEREAHSAARIEFQRREAQPYFGEPALRRQIARA